MRDRILILAFLVLAGCQYTAEPISTGSFNVYSSFDGELSGKYLLYVEASKLDEDVKPSGLNCSAHTYPLKLSRSFANSARMTFANLVDEIEMVDRPVDRSALASHGARGLIIIRGTQMMARLRGVAGFWTATMEADVEIVASIVIDGKNQRLLGNTVSGDGRGEADAGGLCEGGSDALSEAALRAVRDTLTRLGEAMVNSERVRSAS